MLAYFACFARWIPYHFMTPVHFFLDAEAVMAAHDVELLLRIVNLSLKFVIYGFKNPRLCRCYFSFIKSSDSMHIETMPRIATQLLVERFSVQTCK